MKIPTLFLCFTALFAKAELPIMTEEKGWLGYFTAWDDKLFDYGFGDDGEGIMHIMKGKERMGHTDFTVHCRVQEEMNGKWVSRQLLPDGGLVSESKGGLNPSKPVPIIHTFTGDTKVEFLMTKSRGEIIIKPKILEKTTENPIRVVVEMKIPNLFRHMDEVDEKEKKKLLRSDLFSALRASDGKKVKAKFSDEEIDLLGEDFLEKGALEVEFKSKKMGSRSIVVGQGSEKIGVLEIDPSNPFFKGMKVLWIPDQSKLGEKDCFVTFAVE
ncbi:hypothetical protein N9259_02100 [bacterium]|nr:hypothetical protein [bacterium]